MTVRRRGASPYNPLFKTNEEALYFYQRVLQNMAEDEGCSVEELIIKADNSSVYNEFFSKVREVSRKVYYLKELLKNGRTKTPPIK